MLVDSTALGAIMQTEHRFRGQGRTLSLVALNGSAAAVLLELTGLRRRFDQRLKGLWQVSGRSHRRA